MRDKNRKMRDKNARCEIKMQDKNARCEIEYCEIPGQAPRSRNLTKNGKAKTGHTDSNVIFLVSLHYQSLQIIVFLLQACLLEILTSFVRCDRGGFIEHANTFHPTIKFTAEISENKITFLDTAVFKGERFIKKIHPRHQNSLQADGNLSIYPVYLVPTLPGVKRGLNKGEAILGNPGADSWVMRKSKRPISLQERKRSLWDSSFKQLSVIGNKNILVPTQGAALFVLLSTAVYLFLECFFISGVKFFTFCNRNLRTFDLLIVKGDTLRLLIVKCVSYD